VFAEGVKSRLRDTRAESRKNKEPVLKAVQETAALVLPNYDNSESQMIFAKRVFGGKKKIYTVKGWLKDSRLYARDRASVASQRKV